MNESKGHVNKGRGAVRPPPGMLGDANPQSGELRRYLRVIEQRKWTILVVLVVVVAAGVAWTLRQTPIYQATATVQVDLRAPSVLGREVEQVEELGTGSYWNNQEYLQTQLKVIQSRKVAARVVRSLHLDQDPDFGEADGVKRSVNEIAEALRRRITAEPVKDSRLLKISFEDPDPERARDIANSVADAYLEQNAERMLSATVAAVDWLARQSTELQRELEESERALHAFRQDHDILSVSLEDRQNIVANQIQKLSDALTSARTHRIDLGAKVAEMRQLSKTDPLEMPVSRLIDNELVQELKREYTRLAREREGLSQRYGKNWPRIREIDSEIEGIRESIGREVRSVLEAMEGEYRAAKRMENGIRAALDEVQQEALKLNVHEVEYNRLRRAQKNNAKLYDLVLNRTRETDLSRLLKVNNLRVLDYAVTPRQPVKPRVPINILISVVLGLFLGLGLVLVLDALDVTVKGEPDLERLDLAVLGVIPSMDSAVERRQRRDKSKGNGKAASLTKDLFVYEHPKSTVAEACRSLRTNLLFMSPEDELGTLLVTSPGPQEGKTTLAVSVGVVMAQGGARTVLIDTDMRRPRLHKALGIDNRVGISSAIVGRASLDDVVKDTPVEGLYAIPCGPVPPNPAELLHTERFKALLAEARERFDRVIFDSPPLGPVTDAAILGTLVDGVILVTKSSATRKDSARHSVRQLRELGAPLLGAVLNDVDVSKRGYGYSYYYYKRRGYYYAYGQDGRRSSAGVRRADDDHGEQPRA